MTQGIWYPLAENLPDLAASLRADLLAQARVDLAGQVGRLLVTDRCACISDDCATFQTSTGYDVTQWATEEDVESVYNCLSAYGDGVVFAVRGQIQRVELLALTAQGKKFRDELHGLFP